MPPSALTSYEALRADVFSGRANSEGLAALRFHGLLRGLAILLSTARQPKALAPAVLPSNPVRVDGALVRVLANLVLRTHEELVHVY